MFTKYPLLVKFTFLLLFLILLIYALIVARDFLYPLAFAVLISYLLYPIAYSLEKLQVPRILSIILSILFGLFIVLSAFFLISKQLSVFLNDIPALQNKAMENVDNLEFYIQEKFGLPIEQQDQYLKNVVAMIFESSGSWLQEVLTATAGTVVKFALMPVYVFFMLYYRNKFKKVILHMVPPDKHVKADVIIKEISAVTKRYMVGVVIVILILCVLNSIGLLIIGLKYAILLGIMSALMNFIPYFGTLIGGAIPLTFAMLTGDTPHLALYVVILFLIIQFLENNILTPNITGGQVSINPFITILSIILGGMIWGLPGMFVSVPFLGMFKIICDHFDRLEPIAFLLGTQGTEQHNVTFNKIRSIFKRKKTEEKNEI